MEAIFSRSDTKLWNEIRYADLVEISNEAYLLIDFPEDVMGTAWDSQPF